MTSIRDTARRLQRTPALGRLLHSTEPADAAVRFAIAEAVVKAYDGTITIRQVQVGPRHNGRRFVAVDGVELLTSVTRCGDMVTAIAWRQSSSTSTC